MPKPMKKPMPKMPAKKAMKARGQSPGRPKSMRTEMLDMMGPKERARYKR